MQNISVVIPTKNEEATIAKVIEDVRKEIVRTGHKVLEIIVADDSKDHTRKLARDSGAVIINGGGKGLGLAMYKGLKYSLEKKPDIVLSIDADGQSDVDEISKFLDPVIANEADLVLGSRFQFNNLVRYKYRFRNRYGIRILVNILRFLTKQKLTDSHGGLRAMTPEVIRQLEMIGSHTYVQETIIDAVEKGLRVKEIPSVWNTRKHGSSRVVGSIPLYIFYTLPALILRSGMHIKMFYTLGLIFLILACADFFVVGFQTEFSFSEMLDRQSFHLITLFISLSFQLFSAGFILDLLASVKRTVDGIQSNTK